MATNHTAIEVANPAGPAGQDLVLAPLVDQVAQGFAKVLVVAMKELELHIANETRKVGTTVGLRLDTLQASLQSLAEAVSEQRSMSLAVQQKCDELAAATASLRESDARQDADVAALRVQTVEASSSLSGRIDTAVEQLRGEAKSFSTSASERIENLEKEVGVQQEDIGAIKSTLGDFSSRVDALVERLDRQAEALHSMYATYTRRETELEQLVEGLTRLRSYAPSAPANRL